MSLWIAMPLILIWRGTNDSSPELALTVEYAIISVCGLLFGFLLLTLFIAKSDSSERIEFKESLWVALCSVGIYMLAWLIYWVIDQNNVLISVCGLYLGLLLGVNADNFPTLYSQFISSLIFGAVYFLAILFGMKIARLRRERELKDLK